MWHRKEKEPSLEKEPIEKIVEPPVVRPISIKTTYLDKSLLVKPKKVFIVPKKKVIVETPKVVSPYEVLFNTLELLSKEVKNECICDYKKPNKSYLVTMSFDFTSLYQYPNINFSSISSFASLFNRAYLNLSGIDTRGFTLYSKPETDY